MDSVIGKFYVNAGLGPLGEGDISEKQDVSLAVLPKGALQHIELMSKISRGLSVHRDKQTIKLYPQVGCIPIPRTYNVKRAPGVHEYFFRLNIISLPVHMRTSCDDPVWSRKYLIVRSDYNNYQGIWDCETSTILVPELL